VLFVCVAVRLAKDLHCSNSVLYLTHVYHLINKHALVIFNVKLNALNGMHNCLRMVLFSNDLMQMDFTCVYSITLRYK